MRLVQFRSPAGRRHVAIVSESGTSLRILRDTERTYDLALAAAGAGHTIEELATQRAGADTVDYDTVIRDKRMLLPLDHPDAYHCLVSGTGLSHLGSAAARDSMHAKIQTDEASLTDSMKMFKWGVEGGKPAAGQIGIAPEWFYKGDGRCAVAPELPLELPNYALDGGEEVEVVGLYVIGKDGEVMRVGFALGNEYSDHVMERQNYLYLAHSKLRHCSFGPELLLGELPKSVAGHARLLRDGREIWSAAWLSGEDNMCHSISNLEHHHFKYREFRQPGDVHVHYFGAATGSFAQKIETKLGDVFEISAEGFGQPLRNTLGTAQEPSRRISVRIL